jgi:hypothetical protein
LAIHLHTLEFEKLCNHDMFCCCCKSACHQQELTRYFNHLLYRMHCC